MRSINWPTRFDPYVPNCSIHVLVCVWSQMGCCKWCKLGFGVQLRYTQYWRHNDLIYPCNFQWHICQQINCSKHDVTMVNGSHATVRTCNDYSGSSMGEFVLKVGHDTLLWLTWIMKVLVEGIVQPAKLCGCQISIPGYEIVGFTCVWSCVHNHTCWSC